MVNGPKSRKSSSQFRRFILDVRLPWSLVRASCPESREGGFVQHEFWAPSQGAVLRRMECRNALGGFRIGDPRYRRVYFCLSSGRASVSRSVSFWPGGIKAKQANCSAQRLANLSPKPKSYQRRLQGTGIWQMICGRYSGRVSLWFNTTAAEKGDLVCPEAVLTVDSRDVTARPDPDQSVRAAEGEEVGGSEGVVGGPLDVSTNPILPAADSKPEAERGNGKLEAGWQKRSWRAGFLSRVRSWCGESVESACRGAEVRGWSWRGRVAWYEMEEKGDLFLCKETAVARASQAD
ncbi:hypothetical protein QBC39DRAFT_52102 [Podospora conica]|nr:hypothetical protein QBC39DRAFT_52102 [Schizothecium conicum]